MTIRRLILLAIPFALFFSACSRLSIPLPYSSDSATYSTWLRNSSAERLRAVATSTTLTLDILGARGNDQPAIDVTKSLADALVLLANSKAAQAAAAGAGK